MAAPLPEMLPAACNIPEVTGLSQQAQMAAAVCIAAAPAEFVLL